MPDVQTSTPPVIHDPGRSRFQCLVGDQLCVADYQLLDGVMWLTHTEVPRALQGRGIAAELVRVALDHARSRGLKVRPACSYVRSYMQRHTATRDLLAAP